MSDDTEREGEDEATATKREGPGTSAKRHDSKPVEQLSRGTLVGRYVILDVVGEGGMGVVYGAYDPELDRKVAVKLLQATPGGSESGGQAWLTREAQAMARLSHPNVIAVYDVGTLPGDRVFVAMELVEGGTMRTWLEAEHSWREVVAVMRAAGAGLAAAHGAGLVHRDFKPDNVLVGKDGRVRVMDFGLARLHTEGPASRDSDLSIEQRSPLSEQLTVAGTVVGTPAYMAPEIYSGIPADARTDQFAFGVTLYEALYKTRPYHKRELQSRDVQPKMKPPPAGTKVPAAIQRVVARACAIVPSERFASMDELLAELAVDPGAKRRRALVAVGAVAALGVLVGGGVMLSRSRDQVCKGAERKLVAAWDEPTKRAIQQAFAATRHVHADTAFASVSTLLDKYANDWTVMSVESCQATRVHRDQSEADMALRTDCLNDRAAELRALTQLFVKADSDTVDKAEKAASGLDPISTCANLPLLRAPTEPPPGSADQLAKIKETMTRARVAVLAGKIGASINAANETVELAKKLNYDPMLAEALSLRGTASFAGGDPFGALEDLTQSAMAAIRGRRDDVLAETALFCAIATSQLRKDDAANTWLAIGVAAASRVSGNRGLESRRYQTEGIVKARIGNYKDAIAADEKALALALEAKGDIARLQIAQAEQELATAYTGNLEYAKALPHQERAHALLEEVETPENPDIAIALGTLGMIYGHLGDTAKARASFEHAMAIRERTYGKESPALVPTLNNIADMLHKNGDAKGALPYIERAIPLAEKFGKTNSMYQTIATTYAEILFDVDRRADSRQLFDKLLADEDQGHSPVLAQTLISRAVAEVSDGKFAEGATFAEHAIASVEATEGKESPQLWLPLATLAEAKAGLGKPDEARPLFERAFKIAKAAQTSDTDLAHAKAAFAKLK